jgi:flagellar biosynthesis GTPase FlhF
VAVEPEPVAAPEPEPVAVQPAPARLATAPPRPPEAEARPVINELVAQGVTERWALELTGAAAAHANPFTPAGSLRDAVRATLAASLPAAAPLPAAGAAIAFVGAGGAGKTRISAALASAYGRSSTLSVSVVSLDTTKDAKQLTQLLKGREIEVIVAGDAAGASEMIAGGRAGGLVIIDTGGVTPADEAAVRTLERELESLDLDAAYVAVPATLSMHAAKKLIETLERLQPSGIVVTHADESDHLGVAAELSCLTGIPVAYIHEGLDLDNAVSAPDPAALAARLLP